MEGLLKMRAIWSVRFSLGMVSIPVRLFTAAESHDVSFHLLHKNWRPIEEPPLVPGA